VTTDCNTTDQGKQVSSTFTATAPTLGVVSPPLQSCRRHHGASLLGEGQGEERVHATITGEGWAVTAGVTGFSAPGVPRITSSLTIDPCLRRNEGDSILSVSPPPLTPAVVPGSFRGGPTPCANCVGHSGMSREPGEAGCAHRGWDGEEGVHADRSDKRDGAGLSGWGQVLGVG